MVSDRRSFVLVLVLYVLYDLSVSCIWIHLSCLLMLFQCLSRCVLGMSIFVAVSFMCFMCLPFERVCMVIPFHLLLFAALSYLLF